jgi:hypothetical protein
VLEALAGGAIGSILVGLAWVGARLWAVPADVRAHDREAAFINEGLEIWVADDYRKLRQELNGITNELAGRGLLNSGIHGAQRSEAKTRYLHRYRDQLHQATRGSRICAPRKDRPTGPGVGGDGSRSSALLHPRKWRRYLTTFVSRRHDTVGRQPRSMIQRSSSSTSYQVQENPLE